MARTTTAAESRLADKTTDKRLKESKKLLVVELLLMIPVALLGFAIALYPISLPALYLLVLRFLE